MSQELTARSAQVQTNPFNINLSAFLPGLRLKCNSDVGLQTFEILKGRKMRKSLITKSILALAITTAVAMSTSSAMAACVFTEWTNVMPNHALPTITGRLCGTDMSVNVIGADPSGQTFDFGWANAAQLGPDSFEASFVDANATNTIKMDIIPVLKSMHVAIDTKLTSGSNTQWTADYVLTKTY